MTHKTSIGARLRECRKRRDISQEGLAKMLGYTDRSTIAKMESGKNAVPKEQIPTIANLLGVSEAYLKATLEDALTTLGVTITETGNSVLLSDALSSHTKTYPQEDWFVLQNEDNFRKVWADLFEKEEAPAPTEDKRSEIQAIFDQLTSDNRSKLLELAHLYLAAQGKSGETQ